ncbi:CidA/LrgA family protein [Salinivibrio sp. IB643]|uniref:CidA/LrgA family protein n=1 Tax=Salinivibrio sp. IB643 TaxID=1909445 RepID=UPI000989147E|nr:CidA/LrgA family protein [Salinivibrio sp. IB643]OOE99376.1 CidA/LrgA family protein [Salinivibrio sp. IB643]
MQLIKNVLLTLLQVFVLAGIWFLSDWLVTTFAIPLPANLTGMLLLLGALMLKIIRADWLRRGAAWLLAEMLLFFVPAVVAVVNYQDLLLREGGKIMVVLILSTAMVIASTAWVVDKVYRFEVKMARRRSNHHTHHPDLKPEC